LSVCTVSGAETDWVSICTVTEEQRRRWSNFAAEVNHFFLSDGFNVDAVDVLQVGDTGVCCVHDVVVFSLFFAFLFVCFFVLYGLYNVPCCFQANKVIYITKRKFF